MRGTGNALSGGDCGHGHHDAGAQCCKAVQPWSVAVLAFPVSFNEYARRNSPPILLSGSLSSLPLHPAASPRHSRASSVQRQVSGSLVRGLQPPCSPSPPVGPPPTSPRPLGQAAGHLRLLLHAASCGLGRRCHVHSLPARPPRRAAGHSCLRIYLPSLTPASGSRACWSSKSRAA